MDRSALKAILMAILSPQGSTVNLNKMNMDYMEGNADEILKRCVIFKEPEAKVSQSKDVKNKSY